MYIHVQMTALRHVFTMAVYSSLEMYSELIVGFNVHLNITTVRMLENITNPTILSIPLIYVHNMTKVLTTRKQ